MTEKKDDQPCVKGCVASSKPIHQVAHFKLEFSMDLSTRFLSFATTDGYNFTFSLSEQLHLELNKANAELTDIQARLLA